MNRNEMLVSRWSLRRRFRICAWMDTSRAETGSSQTMTSGSGAREHAI